MGGTSSARREGGERESDERNLDLDGRKDRRRSQCSKHVAEKEEKEGERRERQRQI
jgi:hypothetical protein